MSRSRMYRPVHIHSNSNSEKICEKHHHDKIERIKKNYIIDIWQSDFRYSSNINNRDFCHSLNSTWFHNINDISQYIYLSTDDLQKIKEMYLTQVYTPENFMISWRQVGEWKDEKGNVLELKDITVDEIKKYYFQKCPKDDKKVPAITMFCFMFIIVTILFAIFY